MSDGRVPTGVVDGECAHLAFAAGDVAFPVRVVVRDKRSGKQAPLELSLREAKRTLEALAESIDVAVVAARPSRGASAPRRVGRPAGTPGGLDG